MLEDKSVTLITAGRAIQYFDFEPFFSECKRVLKPNGIVAFYSSDHTEFVIPDSPDKAQRLNDRFRKVCRHLSYFAQCLKIIQNVSFEFSGFQKHGKIDHFWHFL